MSSLMDLRVIVITPVHMRALDVPVAPLMQAIPQYKMLMGSVANDWKNFIVKNTFTVGGISGDFNSIQNCLNAVPAGSFIKVYPGVYNETIAIAKSVTLVGAAGLSNTFLTTTVTISASHVTVDGFTFKGNPRNEPLLTIEGSHVHIQNCNFTGEHTVDRPIDLHNAEIAIPCHKCRHVKILNNIFFRIMFALSLDKAEHFTVRNNVFSHGYASIVTQRSASIYVSGNLFEFNTAVMWVDNSLEAPVPSFGDNVYHNSLQSDVCLQYRNQIIHNQESVYLVPKFGEFRDLECQYLNIVPAANTTARDVMALPDHVTFKGWCGSQVDGKQGVGTPVVEEQLSTLTGCILLLGNVIATNYPQGTYAQLCCVMIFYLCGFLGSYLHPNFPSEIIILSNVSVKLDFQRSQFYRGIGQWYYNDSPLYGSVQKLIVSKEGRYVYVLMDNFEVLEVHSTTICE